MFLDGSRGVPGKINRNVAKIFIGADRLIIGQKTMLSGTGFNGASSFKGMIKLINDVLLDKVML